MRCLCKALSIHIAERNEMIRRTEFLIAVPALILAGAVLAADNAALVNKPVRVQVTGITGGAVPGKLISIEGCLYVQFDQKTKDGFVSVRLDQVTRLEVAGASLDAMLKQEPKKCFEEANG
jgi:hypothetical protein